MCAAHIGGPAVLEVFWSRNPSLCNLELEIPTAWTLELRLDPEGEECSLVPESGSRVLQKCGRECPVVMESEIKPEVVFPNFISSQYYFCVIFQLF